MGTENRGMSVWIRIVAGVWTTAAVSGIVKIYGLDDVVFFNKGVISLGTFLLGVWAAGKAQAGWYQDRRKFAIAYFMAWGLVFSEVLGTAMRLDVTRGGVNLHRTGVGFMAVSALVLALIAVPFFSAVMGFSVQPKREHGDRFRLNKVFFAAWGILFVGYIPCILAFYPGLYCYDMVWQWAQFDAWEFTTHHPLIHTLFGGALIELGRMLGGSYNRGLFLHSLVQTLFLTGAMAYGIRFLVKWGMNRLCVMLTGMFFLLFPFFPVMGISTTKDTVFAGFFLITFIGVCDMAAERKIYRRWSLIRFVVCGVMMCLFRNNAVYGLAVMAGCFALAWLVQRIKKQDQKFLLKAAGLTVACILLSQGMFTVLERGLHAAKGSKAEMLSLPMQQMARAYVYHQEEFSSEERDELLRFFDESCLLRYKYYVSDPVKAGMHMEQFELADFIRLWIRLGKRFPEEYVKSPFYNMMGLWYMGGDSSCYMEYKMSQPFDEEHRVETRSKLPWLKDYYSWFTDENLQEYLPGLSVFFYTSFYSWCVALAAGILLAKRKYLYLPLPLFLASYGFTLVFGPCMIIRYFLGIMLCIPILWAMVFQADPAGLQEDGDTARMSELAGIQSPAGSYELGSEELCRKKRTRGRRSRRSRTQLK